MKSVGISNTQEKPKYGYYVGYTVIITFIVIGLVGLALLIIGFYFGYYFNIIFWVIGAIVTMLFLLPGIGMLSTNRSSYREAKLHFDFLKEYSNAQILDCGCGTGRHAIPLAKQMTEGSFLTGIDIYDTKSISLNSIERVRKNAELEGVSEKTKFMFGSLTDIPFDNESFDIVTCMGVMHELGKLKSKAFQEIYRVLKSDGLFYFRELKRVSVIPSIGIFALVVFKSKDYWENELENSNFNIVDKYKRGHYFEFLAKKLPLKPVI